MRAQVYKATNDLEPRVLKDAPPTEIIRDILKAAAREKFYEVDDIRRADEGDFKTLQDAKAIILDKFTREVPEHFENRGLVSQLAARTFDVLCKAYELADADCADITALYVYIGIKRVRYGQLAKYGNMHFEHPENPKLGVRLHNSSFVLSTFPAQTECTRPQDLTFEDYVASQIERGIAPRPEGAPLQKLPSVEWSKVSGFVGHGAPRMPDSHEAACAEFIKGEHAELAQLAITPSHIWRVVAHGGVRFANQYFVMGQNGARIAGRDIAPEVIQALTPNLHRRRLAIAG